MTIKKDYLLYWDVPLISAFMARSAPLTLVALDAASDVAVGDTIWIFTRTPNDGSFVVGRLLVGELPVIEGVLHAEAEAGSESSLKLVHLSPESDTLHFEDTDFDDDSVKFDELDLEQFQSPVKLTPCTSNQMAEQWKTGNVLDQSVDGALEYQDLLAVLQDKLTDDPDDSATRFTLISVLTHSDQLEEAELECQRAIEGGYNPDVAHFLLGQLLFRLNRHDEAIEQLQTTLRINDQIGEAHIMLGTAYATTGQFEQCIEAFSKGIELCPDSPTAFQNLGRAYFEMTNIVDAIIAFTKSLEMAPDNADVHFSLGRCYRALDSDKEMESYRKALEIDPNHVDSLFALGTSWAVKKSGSHEGLDYLYTDGVYDPLLPSHQFYKGLGYCAQGLTELTTQQLRNLYLIAPNSALRFATFM